MHFIKLIKISLNLYKNKNKRLYLLTFNDKIFNKIVIKRI